MNTIHEIMASEPHNSYYLIKYIKFIRACQVKNESIDSNVYTEKHHICPKSIFPEFTSFTEYFWNCIVLTYKQHQVAHVILAKVYPDNVAMRRAAAVMKWKKQALGELNKGTVVVKDKQGNTLRVSLTDSRYTSGELVHVSKGSIRITDGVSNRTIYPTDIIPKNWKKGVTMINGSKGKVTVKDKQGNTSQVEVTDSRYLAGELVGVTKGIPNPCRLLSDDLVKEIRDHYKNNTFIFSEEFLKTQVKGKDIANIKTLPFTELKAPNGQFLSYKGLLCKYYTTTLNINRCLIREMLDYKTYKDLP